MLADRRSLFYSTFEAISSPDAFDYELENGLPILDSESKSGAHRFKADKVGRGASFDLDGLKGTRKRDH